jgi:2-keto-myo-inositol isomerase
MPSTFGEDVANYADAGVKAMEVWLTKLETHVETHGLEPTKQLLVDRQMALAAASYQGGLLLARGEQRLAHYDHFRRRLDLCQQLGIGTMLVIADFAQEVDSAALEQAVTALRQAAQWAAGFDVHLALEFRSSNAFCASLDTALALVEHAGEPNLGVNLDLFHYYTGPSKFEDLEALPLNRLAFVQVCDLAGVPRELATDSDRVLPGDGDFRLDAVVSCLREKGYAGWVSLELMNPTLWQANPVQVVEVGLTALRRLLGLTQ